MKKRQRAVALYFIDKVPVASPLPLASLQLLRLALAYLIHLRP